MPLLLSRRGRVTACPPVRAPFDFPDLRRMPSCWRPTPALPCGMSGGCGGVARVCGGAMAGRAPEYTRCCADLVAECVGDCGESEDSGGTGCARCVRASGHVLREVQDDGLVDRVSSDVFPNTTPTWYNGRKEQLPTHAARMKVRGSVSAQHIVKLIWYHHGAVCPLLYHWCCRMEC